MREAIGIGMTVDQAISDAVTKLALSPEDDFQFEIIDQPKKKILGMFGGGEFKIRVYIEDSQPEPKVVSADSPKKKVPAAKPRPAKPQIKSDKKADDNRPVASREEVSEASGWAEEYLRGVLDKLELVDVKIETTTGDGSATIELVGEKLGVIIGRHGETLDSLQYLCNIVANSKRKNYVRITLDTGNYRAKRAKTLEGFAQNIAAKVRRTGRNQVLEPMNPNERRVIHTVIQDMDGIASWSVGDGMGRRVVIGQRKGGDRPQGQSGRRERSGYGNRDSRGANHIADKGFSSAADNRQPKKDKGDTPLYGRIEK